MKIIGEGNGNLILEAKREEISNLCGYYFEFSDGAVKNKFKISVGMEIEVNKMFMQLYNFAQNQHNIKRTIDQLRYFADTLELVNPFKDQPHPKEE